MTTKQSEILGFLQAYYDDDGDFISPTELGEVLFMLPSWEASSYTSPTLLRMAKKGWLERAKSGRYRITADGRRAYDNHVCNKSPAKRAPACAPELIPDVLASIDAKLKTLQELVNLTGNPQWLSVHDVASVVHHEGKLSFKIGPTTNDRPNHKTS